MDVPLRRRLRGLTELGSVLAVSLVFWLILGVGRPELMTARTMLLSLIIGLSIYGTVRLAMRLFGRRIDRLPPRGRRLGRLVLYFVGGALGYVLGGSIVEPLFGVRVLSWNRGTLIVLVVVGAIAVALALAFAGYERMRRNLEQSVTHLKEAEFAERELEMARTIQQRLLPPAVTVVEGYVVVARNLAARRVAGDFYDVFRATDGGLGLVVADVAGKGMGAGLIMATVKARLPLLAAERSVADTIGALNERLAEELSPREFVALAYARLDPASGDLELANAGLPDPYLICDGRVLALAVPGPRLPLGRRRDLRYQTLRTKLGAGERLLLVTDGLPEAPLASGEPLGYEALAGLLSSIPAAAGETWLDGLLAAVRARTRPTLEDDWTALLVERLAGPHATAPG